MDRRHQNMFSVFGFLNPADVSTTFGQLYKLLGAHIVGTLGYGISPSSADSAKGAAVSAQAAGLKVGYLNANFPFGGTNVAPEALAMKTAGVDGLYGSVDPNTSFALITALRQDGDHCEGRRSARWLRRRPEPGRSGRPGQRSGGLLRRSPTNRWRCTRPPRNSSRAT